MIRNGFKDLKEEITNMIQEGKKVEKPNEIVDIENILVFNRQHQRQGLKC